MTKLSDILDFTRVRHLAARDLRENGKKYLLSMLVLFGVLLICVIYIQYNIPQGQRETELINFMFVMFISGSIWASIAYKEMSTAATRSATLMLPASSLEKFLLRWFISVPVFLIALILMTMLAEETKGILWPAAEAPIRLSQLFNGEMSTSSHTLLVTGFFLFIQSLFMLGGLLWQKIAVIKTFLCGGLIYALYYFTAMFVTIIFIPEKCYIDYTLGDLIIEHKIVASTIIIAATVFNYLLAYIRFKESEIINRW